MLISQFTVSHTDSLVYTECVNLFQYELNVWNQQQRSSFIFFMRRLLVGDPSFDVQLIKGQCQFGTVALHEFSINLSICEWHFFILFTVKIHLILKFSSIVQIFAYFPNNFIQYLIVKKTTRTSSTLNYLQSNQRITLWIKDNNYDYDWAVVHRLNRTRDSHSLIHNQLNWWLLQNEEVISFLVL